MRTATPAVTVSTTTQAMGVQNQSVKDPQYSLLLPNDRLLEEMPSPPWPPGTLYRALPEMRPNGNLDSIWKTKLHQQLLADLGPASTEVDAKLKKRPLKERVFSADLRMTGFAAPKSTVVMLRPCVWVACGSSACRKIVAKVIKNICWLEDYAIDGCKATLRGVPMLAAYNKPAVPGDEWGLKLDLDDGIQLSKDFTAYIHVQEEPRLLQDSAMGLICCSTLTKNGTIVSQKLSTLGGVVTQAASSLETTTGPTIWGVTTAHNLLEPWLDMLDENIAESDDSDTEMRSSSSDDEEDIQHQANINATLERSAKNLQAKIERVLTWRNVSAHCGGSFANIEFGPLVAGGSEVQAGFATHHTNLNLAATDALVLKMPDGLKGLKNVCLQVGKHQPSHDEFGFELHGIGMFETGSNLVTDDAWGMRRIETAQSVDRAKSHDLRVLNLTNNEDSALKHFVVEDCGAPIEAEVLAGTVPLYLGGSSLRTTRIKTSRSLDVGSSGCWVISGSNVRGVIVAVFPETAYALMIPTRDFKAIISKILTEEITMSVALASVSNSSQRNTNTDRPSRDYHLPSLSVVRNQQIATTPITVRRKRARSSSNDFSTRPQRRPKGQTQGLTSDQPEASRASPEVVTTAYVEGEERNRKPRPSEEPPEEPFEEPSEEPSKGPSVVSSRPRFACLFYLYDRILYRACRKCRFRGFDDLKQHLLDPAHRQALHCPRCAKTFEGDDAPDQWRRSQCRSESCLQIDFKPPPGVTEDQKEEIFLIPEYGSGGNVKNCQDAWKILFPDQAEFYPDETTLLLEDTYESQYMSELKDSILSEEQWSTRQPYWNTSILAEASPEQRRTAFQEIVTWFISEERQQLESRKAKLEYEAAVRLKRPRPSTKPPPAEPEPEDDIIFFSAVSPQREPYTAWSQDLPPDQDPYYLGAPRPASFEQVEGVPTEGFNQIQAVPTKGFSHMEFIPTKGPSFVSADPGEATDGNLASTEVKK